jgi:3-deoxy-manno-octulosonate cytidylyltransferase (CMP-KDO synthetase)
MKNKIAIFIPARLASIRLPNKPLADICGQTMIQRVYNQALKADLGEVFIACDSEKMALEIKKFTNKYIITNPDLPSGTDRIYAALKSLSKENTADFEVIINLQGDLPDIDPVIIRRAGISCLKNNHDIVTLASIIEDKNEITNPNVVKIAIAENKNNNQNFSGLALYFSRNVIPHGEGNYYHHIGIYAYKKQILEKFVSLPPSLLEKREKLEQLRALENNIKINVEIIDSHPVSVDTKQDLEKIIKLINDKENSQKKLRNK